MATFITIENDLITLGQFLKFSKIINNGGEARHFLLNNVVLVNKTPEQRRGRKIRNGDVIEINNQEFVVKNQGA
ncbi:MAG: RNA-binding S4 domain-containing protein [Mycoplasmataceae bacterium]|jgi:ribosome-associated protein|nr:RNA-binding S4 domain-containing protein [Mycoplasmataceae bacterium]